MRRLFLLLPVLAGACARGEGGPIVATGTLQVDEVDIGPIVPSRVVRVFVEEGDSVTIGDTLVTLTQATLAPDLAIQEARLQAAQAQLLELERGARPAELRRAEAQFAAASAEAEPHRGGVRPGGAACAGRHDQPPAAGQRPGRRLDRGRQPGRAGRHPSAVAGGRSPRARGGGARRGGQRAGSGSRRACHRRGTGAHRPGSRRGGGRHVLPGEVVGAGQSAVTVARAERPWARIYVGERLLPRLQPGQEVVGVLDGVSKARFTGRVEVISTSAEFTPRVALTERERADLLFAVRVEFTPTPPNVSRQVCR